MKNDYLTQKKPLSALIVFALPMIVGNLFQQTYTMADSAIVGRLVGEDALAAVGASYALTNVFICIAVGGGVGASVIVSRHFGAKEYSRMKLAVSTAFLTFLAVSLLLAAFGLAFCRQIMLALHTPPEVLDMAVQYLGIYFCGLPFLFMYNVISSMFNALGKSRIPLCFLVFSSLFNIGLDLVLVQRFRLGVAGVAWATLIAQGLSALLSFGVFLYVQKKLECGKTGIFDKKELADMTRIALPSILQQSIISIGMMLVQSVVNGFGPQALAGFSAGIRVESICVVPMAAIGNAMSSYTAQNLGAKKEDRIVTGYHAANLMVIFCALVVCLALELFHSPMIAFFLGSEGTETAMATGNDYLVFMGWFFCLIGFKMAVDGLLRGAGDMRMFTIANLANLFFRVAASMSLAPVFGIEMVWVTVPVGWLINWAISFARYRTGKWRQITPG